jgi:hypothetical protein
MGFTIPLLNLVSLCKPLSLIETSCSVRDRLEIKVGGILFCCGAIDGGNLREEKM